MRRTSATERGPLHEMERLGTQVPAAVKKVHARRHNSVEGREPSQSVNQQEKTQMSEPAQNIQPETPAPAQAPAQPAVLVEVDPKGTTAKDLNLNITTREAPKPEKTTMQKVGEAAERVATIAGGVTLGLLIVEGGKAVVRYFWGGEEPAQS